MYITVETLVDKINNLEFDEGFEFAIAYDYGNKYWYGVQKVFGFDNVIVLFTFCGGTDSWCYARVDECDFDVVTIRKGLEDRGFTNLLYIM